jgi:hypothetical protein
MISPTMLRAPTGECTAVFGPYLRGVCLDICTLNIHPSVAARVEAAKCSSCLGTNGCGYCLSTLRCVEGSDGGPSDGSPCPNWVFETSECPGEWWFRYAQPLSFLRNIAIPTCETHTTCDGCAGIDDCAWCASEKKCMTVSDIFSRDCRGTVFELPCPASFVAGL